MERVRAENRSASRGIVGRWRARRCSAPGRCRLARVLASWLGALALVLSVLVAVGGALDPAGSSAWDSLGGTAVGSPAMSSWGPGRLDVFVRGSDDGLWHRYYQNGWGPWEDLGGVLTSEPAAVSWGSGRIDVFARGSDGQLWHRFSQGGWGPWEPLGGQLTGSPGVASWGPGRLDVFARGTDGRLWHRYFAGFWGPWESPLGGALGVGTGPAAVSWGPGRIDVFVAGTDSRLYHAWFDHGWHGWEVPVPGSLLGATSPSAASWGPGWLSVWVTGTDLHPYQATFDGGWNAFQGFASGTSRSGPGVTAWAPGRLDVVETGVDGAVWHLAAPPPSAAPGGAAAAPAVVTGLSGTAPFDFPDPSVIRVDGVYYGYATGSSSFWLSTVPIVRSTDLVHWTFVGEALPGGTNQWADLFAYTWGPSVTQVGGNFLLYYAARERLSGRRCIGVAVSTTGPAGPFHDTASAPLVCQQQLGGSIDPDAFVDSNGNRFLLFKSEGTQTEPTRLWSAPLASDGRSLTGVPQQLITTAYAWEQPIVEGPTMMQDAHGYTLFYSASRWETGAYAIGVAHCDGPLGPCSRTYSTPVVANRGSMVGPGGPIVVSGPGGQVELGFHAWTAGLVGYPQGQRSLRFLPISWPFGQPAVG